MILVDLGEDEPFFGGINLVLFDSSALPAQHLRVHDPARDLPRDNSSWQAT